MNPSAGNPANARNVIRNQQLPNVNSSAFAFRTPQEFYFGGALFGQPLPMNFPRGTIIDRVPQEEQVQGGQGETTFFGVGVPLDGRGPQPGQGDPN
tara:strand:- start:430 stop:717 length:288 start_codon:yes stop_codon:yes gene_type:complete